MLMTKKARNVLASGGITKKMFRTLREQDLKELGLLPVRMTGGPETALFLMCEGERLSDAELVKYDLSAVCPAR